LPSALARWRIDPLRSHQGHPPAAAIGYESCPRSEPTTCLLPSLRPPRALRPAPTNEHIRASPPVKQDRESDRSSQAGRSLPSVRAEPPPLRLAKMPSRPEARSTHFASARTAGRNRPRWASGRARYHSAARPLLPVAAGIGGSTPPPRLVSTGSLPLGSAPCPLARSCRALLLQHPLDISPAQLPEGH